MTTRTLRHRAAVVVALGLAAAMTPTAVARPVDLDDRDTTLANRATFPIRQVTWGDVGEALGITDGALGGRSDAFDGGMRVLVDDVGVTAGGGKGDRSGPDLTTRPVTRSGLRVSLAYRAIPRSSTLRVLLRLSNPTRQPIEPEIEVRTNLGSDGDTAAGPTSTGDTSYTTDDRWLITYEGNTPFEESDPVVSGIFVGRGARVETYLGYRATDQVVTSFNEVPVPARGTRYLLFFTRLDTAGVEAALNGMSAFNRASGLSPKLVAGMSPKVRRAVLNWDL